MDANTSNNTSNSSGGKEAKRQQFTNKQRMDMYAFCVLELEMHSNKVSIKKQQQAIQRVLNKQQKETQNLDRQSDSSQPQQLQQSPQQPEIPQPPLLQQTSAQREVTTATTITLATSAPIPTATQQQNEDQLPSQLQEELQQQQPPTQQLSTLPQDQQQSVQQNGEQPQHNDISNLTGIEGKTLLQLQQEVAMTRKCYSDYQKTQVLTSSMLRDVQKRFAKYYPDSAIPSRTTIKHVFEKCVAHGTVENIKTPRKATKIPQGDEIEFLLIHEPQLSLRQMAQKLNVSTGTVSRRCRALGLIPESVTIKHQQLATARRQKQMKQLESQTKREPTNCNNNNTTTTTTMTPNGTHEIEGDLPKYLSK